MKDITIIIPDRGGAVPEVWEALQGADIAIAAAVSFSRERHRVVHIVVDDDAVEVAGGVLAATGCLMVDTRDVLLVDLGDYPGGLAEVTRIAYDGGAGVYLLSLATNNRVMLGAANLDAAQRAFGRTG